MLEALIIGAVLIGLILWSFIPTHRHQTLPIRPQLVYAGFSPEGHIVTVDYEYVVRAYDAEHGTEVGLFKEPTTLGDIIASSDGRYFASTEVAWGFDAFGCPAIKRQAEKFEFARDYSDEDDDDTWLIAIHEWKTKRVVQTLEHPESLTSATFSPDCQMLVLVVGAVIQLWDWKAAHLTASLEELKDVSKVSEAGDPFIHPVAFSPDGRYLAAVAADTVYLWELDSRRLTHLYEDHDAVSSIAFSTDGQLLAIGGGGRIRIRRLLSGEVIRILEVADPWIMLMAFSPDGCYLKSENGSRVWLWKAETGDLLWVSRAPNVQIKYASFGPDSRQLIARYGQSEIIRWSLDNDGMPAETQLLNDQRWVPAPCL